MKIVLADDHDLVRSGLRQMLEMIEGIEIVAEARNGFELIAATKKYEPDVIVSDISMPGMDGFEALSILCKLPHKPRVVIVSIHDSPDFIRRALQLGATSYITKESTLFEIEHAVRSVMAGHNYLSQEVTRALMLTRELTPEKLLTDRQREILSMIASGHASKEIGFMLGLSSKTVDVHRARIMERLGINDLPGLTLYCLRHGLIKL